MLLAAIFLATTACADSPLSRARRKTALTSDDHMLLLCLVIGAVIAIAGSIIGCLVCYFSAPRVGREEARPLIADGRAKFAGPEQAIATAMPDYRYWPGQPYYPQIPAVYFPPVAQPPASPQ
jgi:hypothetical protein